MWTISYSVLLMNLYEISMMGELKFFLGLQIKQTNEGIYIHQSKYMKELLKKFKRDDAKLMKTSMHPTTVLGLDNELKVDEKTYKGMIGSLLYLIASRPNIMSVYAFMPDSKRNQGKCIYLLLNAYLDI